MPDNSVGGVQEHEISDLEHQKDLDRLRRLRPMDDDFMRGMLKDNISLAELIVRIILNKPDFKFISFETQVDMKRVTGARSVIFDGLGTDASGRKIDLEVQRADSGAQPERARYHSSILDVEDLDEGQGFGELPDTCVIFITEKDFFGKGEPIYSIERINITTGEPFNDGSRIVYVNGEYRSESDIGKLMHDFNCSDPDDMYIPQVAESVRYLKETSKGVSEMCKIMEDMKNEAMEKGKILGAIDTLRGMGLSDEGIVKKVAEKYKVTEDFVRNLLHTAA